MGIFRESVFDEFWEKTERTLNLYPTFFDKLVYLEIFTSTFRCNRLQSPKGEYTHFNNENASNIVIRLDYYKEKIAANGSDPRWVLEIPNIESYSAFDEKFIEAYKLGEESQVEHDLNSEPILEILKKGRFDLIGIDRTGWNGTITGIDNKPIPSGFRFTYIESRLFGKRYHLKDLLAYMQARSDVRKSQIIDVPYYNVSDEDGSRCIEFYFIPTKEQYDNIISLDSYNRNQEIFKILNVAQFAKAPVDD